MDSAKMPPPQPTSITFFCCSPPTVSLIQLRRKGLMSCRGLNSLVGSHHFEAKALNFSISVGSTFTVDIIPTYKIIKAPRKEPLLYRVTRNRELLFTGTYDFDLYATVLGAAFASSVSSYRL